MAKIADKLDNINRTLEKILAVMDKRNRSKGHIDVLNKLWEWATEVITTEEIKNMFLDKDGKERTA